MSFRDILSRPPAWVVISVAAFLGTSAHWLRDFERIDSCLDSGHVYNYVNEVCDTEGLTYPVIPYGERHPKIISLGMAAGLLGVVGAAIASIGARRFSDALVGQRHRR